MDEKNPERDNWEAGNMIRDLHGNVIHIDKRGKDYPVDALLKEENGKDVLILSARIFFVPFEVPIGVKLKPWKDNILTGFRQCT